MNGYFGITSNEKGTFLIFKPPVGDGEIIRNNEVKDYLNSHGIVLDSRAVSSAILRSRDEKVVLKIADTELEPINEIMNIYISDDRLHAFVRFIPPSSNGNKLTKNDMLKMLEYEGVIKGIDEHLLEHLSEKKKYCTDYEIAFGKLPTSGRDATIKYHFNTDNSIRPTLLEDGSVDFFHLNMIHHCSKGDVLAEIIPGEKGEDGYDVFGNIKPAREVTDVSFRYGENITLSEDGMRLISGVCGHVMLIDGTVFAADVYEIDNVGTATGNIEYTGNILVKGNVEDNYSLKASGSIEIRGTVGAANIEAGGDIIIANGMYGQGKGKLKAKGNIISKFLESSIVETGGYVEAESILHSFVTAGTSVHVENRKGFITGGHISAVHLVKAKMIGSPMGSDTTVEVGVDGTLKARFVVLQKSVTEHKKANKQAKTIVENLLKKQADKKLNGMQTDYLESLQQSIKEHQDALSAERAEMNRLSEKMEGSESSHIEVTETLYGGTRITISGSSVVIKEPMKHCRLVKSGAEIKISDL